MSESAGWRDASSWRNQSSTGTQGARDAGGASSGWRTGGSSQGRTNPQRQPIRSLAERSRPEDVRVHRPARQSDEPDSAKAIAEGRRIYLGNLLYQTTPENIEEFLKQNDFPAYQNIHISVDPFTNRCPGYCFIEFSDKETAEAAMTALDGKMLSGRAVKCRPCQAKGEMRRSDRGPREEQQGSGLNRWGDWNRSRGNADGAADGTRASQGQLDGKKYFERSQAQEQGRQLYVGGLPRMLDQAMNDEEMRSVFKGFEVVLVSKRVSPREASWTEDGRRNFCFVDFATSEQAQAALEAVNGASYRDSPLKVSMALPRSAREERQKVSA